MRLRVLVADDNKDAADSLAFLLSSWGYEVRVAYDGLAGLESAQREPPQVALIDLALPGMDGYQVALHLRRDPKLVGLKLIAITGYQATPRSRSEEYGFDEHFTKPIDPDQLRAHMKALETEIGNRQPSGEAGSSGQAPGGT
jgi:CheY-like chemotaxis protein